MLPIRVKWVENSGTDTISRIIYVINVIVTTITIFSITYHREKYTIAIRLPISRIIIVYNIDYVVKNIIYNRKIQRINNPWQFIYKEF